MKKILPIVMLVIVFAGVFHAEDFINALTSSVSGTSISVKLHDGGSWSSEKPVLFPDSGKVCTLCPDDSTAFIGLSGTWGWYVKKNGKLDINGKEAEEEPPMVLDYDKFRRNEDKYRGEVTQCAGEVLQTRKNQDGSCYVVVNMTPEKKGSYEKTGVIEMKNHGYAYNDRNLPVPGDKCLVKSVYKGWINYTMNCGTVKYVPLLMLDPMLLCFMLINPNDFLIR